jgi:RimJ/RimL family protein N-acetyltransferase
VSDGRPRTGSTTVQLRAITTGDLALYETLMTDPGMMTWLGGPRPREGLEAKVRSLVEDVNAGRIWYFTVVPDGEEAPVGTVCVWSHEWNGRPINEIGWMILPNFQGRGLATAAVRRTVERARSERRWDVIHAFPHVENTPSNGICRKLGFSLVEEVDNDGPAGSLRCNHWVLDLRDG